MAREIITQEDNITTADLLERSRSSEPASEGQSTDGRYSDREKILPDAEKFRERWHEIQASFVDEPKSSVEKADQLVASVIQQLTKVFADERAKMENDWHRGGDVSTEDLRQALCRYRSFFDRLLSV
jgi:hypothetical protein